jgi:hypothetical protein
MSHVPPLGFNPNRGRLKRKLVKMGTNNPAALACNSRGDGFPFTKHDSRNEMKSEEKIRDAKIAQLTTRTARMADNRTTESTTCAKRIAEVKTAINVVVEAARPTLKESWVEVSYPIPIGSWVEIKDPNLQDPWIDDPPSRAPSCGDDGTPLPELVEAKGKAKFVWGWLMAMGGAVQG